MLFRSFNDMYVGKADLDNLFIANGGDDKITGANLNDTFYGGDGNDAINSLGGNDFINAGRGIDIVDGGENFDTLSFEGANGGLNVGLTFQTVLIDKTTGDVSVGGRATIGTSITNFSNIESFIFTDFDDYIVGTSGRDNFTGNKGSDFLFGAQGNDYLVGGEGDRKSVV